jgi:hypothetical protein
MCSVFLPDFNQHPWICSAGFNEGPQYKISRKSIQWELLFHVNRHVWRILFLISHIFSIPYFNQQNELTKIQ